MVQWTAAGPGFPGRDGGPFNKVSTPCSVEGNRSLRGASRGGPRRLRKRSSSPSRAGCRARRKGAGDASWAACSGRMTTNSVLVACAAPCSRRKASGRTVGSQHNRAAQSPCLRTWSTAHRASFMVCGRSHNSRDGSRRQAAQHETLGMCGGCTRTTCPLSGKAARAGCSRLTSPTPAWGASSSISVPRGHPPPGSSAERLSCPVGRHGLSGWLIWEARHTAGCGSLAKRWSKEGTS